MELELLCSKLHEHFVLHISRCSTRTLVLLTEMDVFNRSI